MVGGIAADVRDGRIEVIHHPHGQHQIQELGGVIRIGGCVATRQQRLRSRVGAQLHAALAERLCHARQERFGHIAVHQQGLQRIAGRRTTALSVHQQIDGIAEVGAGIHEQVADTLVVLDHRHPRMFGNEADQAFAAARNRQIDQFMQLQQFQHRFSAQVGQHGHRRRWHAIGLERARQRLGDGCVGMDRFGATAQDHAIAGLQAQRSRFGGHVRARLIDHCDHTQRHAYLLHADAVWTHIVAGDLADGIGQRGDLTHGFGHREQACRVQRQAVEHGAANALVARGGEVTCITGKDQPGIHFQRLCHGQQQRAAGRTVEAGNVLGRVTAGTRLRFDVAHRGVLQTGHGSTRSSRWTTLPP